MMGIDWSDVEDAAKKMAGNWKSFESFAWHHCYDLEDPDAWLISYTSNRDSGLLAKSNEKSINERLQPFSEDDDPDVVFESHSHWAVGHVDGFSLRVFKTDSTITPAFEELCRINEALEGYPVLDEQDLSEIELEATLQNYASEMWRHKDLPEGWEGEAYSWFSNSGHDRFIESRDDGGGWAPEEKIIEALQDLGLMPSLIIENGRRL